MAEITKILSTEIKRHVELVTPPVNRPLYWLLDLSKNILHSDLSDQLQMNVEGIERMSFPEYCEQIGIESPIQLWDVSNKQFRLNELMELSLDRKPLCFKLTAQVISNNETSYVLIVAVNVTQSMALNAAQLKNSILQEIIDHIPYYLFWKNSDSVFLGCNKMFAKLAHLNSVDEIVGKTDYDLPWEKKESDAYRQDDQQVICSKLKKVNIEETQTIHAKEATILTSKVPLFDQKGCVSGLIGIYNDITERKNMELSLRNAKEQAEQAAQVKSNLMAVVSHELRTPLHAILGSSEVITNRYKDEKLCAHISDIKRSTEVLLNLVNDILDFTQFERGEFKLSLEEFSLRLVIQDLIQQVKQIYKLSDDVIFNYTIDPRVPMTLVGDPLRLQQVLNNFLANAFKFTPHGYVNLKIDVLSSKENSVTLKFSVKDTGCGLAEKEQDLVFNRFYQVGNDGNRGKGGVGIGLSICKQLIMAMNGDIKVQSDLQAGSEFSFVVSFKVSLVEDKIQKDAKWQQPELTQLNSHILLVEDNTINQKIMQCFLTDLACTYTSVVSGGDALKALEHECFDLILLDIGLPDISGVELTHIIRSQHKFSKTPIVALTAHALDHLIASFLEAGMDDVFTKPITLSQLEQGLLHHLKSKASLKN